jgi:hypothetical protein
MDWIALGVLQFVDISAEAVRLRVFPCRSRDSKLSHLALENSWLWSA